MKRDTNKPASDISPTRSESQFEVATLERASSLLHAAVRSNLDTVTIGIPNVQRPRQSAGTEIAIPVLFNGNRAATDWRVKPA